MDIKHIVELLDNSPDAEAIALEICDNENLNSELDYVKACYLDTWGTDKDIAIIIRELWDIAYTHGYYDGYTEAEEDIV